MKNGFTLIELLVVVLIIGILAAIAVPQYQKAVEKARATEAITILRSVVRAQEISVATRGHRTKYWDELDIDFPAKPLSPDNREFLVSDKFLLNMTGLGSSPYTVLVQPKDGKGNYMGYRIMYYWHTAVCEASGKSECMTCNVTATTSSRARKVCEGLSGGKKTYNEDMYLIE